LKFDQFFLFSDQIRRLFQYLRKVPVITGRFALILIKGCRRPSASSIQLNDTFLFSNGLVAINWQLKNFLYVRINNTITTASSKGIVFYCEHAASPLIIKVVGVFASYTASFNLRPAVGLDTNWLRAPAINGARFEPPEIPPLIGSFTSARMEPGFINSSFTHDWQIHIQPITMLIPSFKIEKEHD
jgi:hypothetical protein